MKKILPLFVVVGLFAAGCADAMEEFNDAPRGETNDEPARILAYPDGFGNVAAKCDGPNMVYSLRVGDGGRGVAVVPNDARCAEAGTR